MEEGRRGFKIVIARPTGKITLVRPIRSWEENVRLDLKKIGVNSHWVRSAEDRDY
jgi:hypothetical protein